MPTKKRIALHVFWFVENTMHGQIFRFCLSNVYQTKLDQYSLIFNSNLAFSKYLLYFWRNLFCTYSLTFVCMALPKLIAWTFTFKHFEIILYQKNNKSNNYQNNKTYFLIEFNVCAFLIFKLVSPIGILTISIIST